MYLRQVPVAALLLTVAFAAIDIRREGWLDRMVQYHKERFFDDVENIAPVKINATIIPRPVGYTDSPEWDFDSATRLLSLIKESELAAPVHRALTRMMRPSRRIMMGYKESFLYFPRFPKNQVNNFYYDIDSEEDSSEVSRTPLEDGVIVVSNPVESRLPSAQISVKLLEDIMVARAIAARAMPTTPKSTIPWIPMNKTITVAPNTTVSATATTPLNENENEKNTKEEKKEGKAGKEPEKEEKDKVEKEEAEKNKTEKEEKDKVDKEEPEKGESEEKSDKGTEEEGEKEPENAEEGSEKEVEEGAVEESENEGEKEEEKEAEEKAGEEE